MNMVVDNNIVKIAFQNRLANRSSFCVEENNLVINLYCQFAIYYLPPWDMVFHLLCALIPWSRRFPSESETEPHSRL